MDTIEKVQHEMAILDHTGDTKLIWASDVDDEVEHARKTFNEMRKKGYAAYSVNKKGDKGEVLKEFDPDVEKMILAPPMKGG